jgi:hypothetical protein
MAVNFPIDPERLRIDANLRGWSGVCREIAPDCLPKTILHVCQAVYQAVDPEQKFIALKRVVLERVSGGDCAGAIRAMLPGGMDTRFEELPQGRILAEIRHAKTGMRAASEGNARDCALLGCIVELSLTLDPAQRRQVFG